MTSSHRPRGLQPRDEILVDHGEVAAHVRLDEQVPVDGFDRSGDPTMVAMVAAGAIASTLELRLPC